MASEWYTFWYWTEGPGKGSGMGNPPAGGHGLLPDPPPLPPPPTAPPVIEPAKPPPVEQTFVNWGKVIPISMGMRRMSPQIIWLKAPVFIGVTVKADFAMSWGYNGDDNPADTECTALYANGTKIWSIERGKLLPGSWSWKFYPGTESQGQDPTMVADKGAANTPAYRNQMYGVFRNFPLEKFGFKLPGISAEIMGSGGEAPRNDSWNPADKDPQIVLDTPFTLRKGTYGGITDAANSGVRSRTFHKRGQYYMEIKVDHYDTAWRPRMIFKDWTGIGLGVSLATAGLTTPAGRTSGSVGAATPMVGPINRWNLAPSPPTTSNGVNLDTPLWGTGDTIGFHINMTQGYARARVVSRNGAWSVPVYYVLPAPPGSIHLTDGPAEIQLGDPLYAHANVSVPTYAATGSTTDKQTVNFGASPFLGAIPAGATAWNGTGGADVFLGTLPLRDFISKIALYSGLDPNLDLDFVSITDVIHGGIITQDTEFSSFLAVLGRAYGFDFYEGDVIRIVKRVVLASYTIDKVIPPEDLLTDTDRAITTTRRKDDSPAEIELNYIDVTQQFRWNLQKARRILFPVRTTESQRKDSFSIPIVTTANDALTMASKAMYREAEQNVDHEMKVTSKHFGIEPSDILTITAADTEYTVKVAQVSIEEDMRLTLRVVNLQTDEDMAFDAEAGEPALPYEGNLAYVDTTEGADTFAGTQDISNLWAMDGQDTFTGGAVIVNLIVTEGADTFTASVRALVLSATDRPDTFAGSVRPHVLAATDRPDGFTGVGGAVPATLAATDRPDGFTGFSDFNTLDLDFTTMG